MKIVRITLQELEMGPTIEPDKKKLVKVSWGNILRKGNTGLKEPKEENVIYSILYKLYYYW